MTSKKSFFIILIVNVVIGFDCWAQTNETIVFPEEDTHVTRRNPFVPQLPYKPPEPEVVIEEPAVNPENPDGQGTDPTLPSLPVIEEKKPILGKPTLTISGILWNSDRPQAIVNGNIVEIGDKMFNVPTDKGEVIEQIEFVKIDKQGLHVAFEDKTAVLNTVIDIKKGASK